MTLSVTPDSPIGIFDSGLGGLAVLREVQRMLPGENILFLGDTARQPYGPRTVTEVRGYAVEISGYLIQNGAKMVLIGCNTATVAGLAAAQAAFPRTPIIGMIEPGVRAALKISRTQRIGVWGTEITIASRAYDEAILAANPGASVTGVSCPTILRLAEKGAIGDTPYLLRLATDDLKPVLDSRADTLILGCTDFTCVRPVIDEVTAGRVTVVDPAEEVVREAGQQLNSRGLLRASDVPAGVVYRITGDDLENFATFGAQFLGLPEILVSRVPLAEVQAGAANAQIS